MKINNTSVRGIFLYSPDLVLEKGDFVIYNDTIYVVNPATENGEVTQVSDPSTSSLFKQYLSEKVASLEYSKGFLENSSSNTSDMCVSSSALYGIMNRYMSGFDEKGIITSSISSSGCSEDLEGIVSSTGSELFNQLITAPDLNNTYIRIDRELVRNSNSAGMSSALYLRPETESASSSLTFIILRQYSYYDEGNNLKLTRVQEIIDPMYNYTFFRYGVLDSNYNLIESSDFKLTVAESVGGFSEYVQGAITYYKSIATGYQKKLNSLSGSFRYRNVVLPTVSNGGMTFTYGTGSTNSSTGVITYGAGEVPINFSTNETLVTFVVSETLQSGFYKNYTLTINLHDAFLNDNVVKRYYFTDNYFIEITDSTEDSVSKVLVEVSNPEKLNIINAYFKLSI